MRLDPHRQRVMTIAERHCNLATSTKNYLMQDDVTNEKENADSRTTNFLSDLVSSRRLLSPRTGREISSKISCRSTALQ